MKHLNLGGDVDYTPKRVVVGDAQGVLDRAMLAYDERFAPPPDILAKTFGLIYERRTAAHPDSIAYVFETYSIGPLRMCKAWKIVEHPYAGVAEVGAVARSAGIGGAVVSNANSPVVRHDNGGAAEVGIVQFPCSGRSYTPVVPGSLRSPVPRHPDSQATLAPAAAPAATATPAAAATLAPN